MTAPPRPAPPQAGQRLAPAPAFLRDPDLRAIGQALDGRFRVVGGAVRNALLGLPITDIDLCTPWPPDAVLGRLAAAGIKAVPTGLAHGTVTAVPKGGSGYEITTLRRDVVTDGRHAQVVFTEDYAQDAARRDFTMNALSVDADGLVFDYFGGAEDARAGRVRFVGAPDRRIAEDYLRILRFFRFHAQYGRTPPTRGHLAALARGRDGLDTLSGERIRQEFLKLLTAPGAAGALALMADTGCFARLTGVAPDLAVFGALVSLDSLAGAMPRLAALLGLDAGRAHAVAERWRLTTAERADLAALCSDRPRVDVRAQDPAAAGRALAYWHAPHGRAWVALRAARAHGDPYLSAAFDAVRDFTPPKFPLRGADAVALGMAPGPGIKAALDRVERTWVDSDFALDRAGCLDLLSAQLSGPGGGGGH